MASDALARAQLAAALGDYVAGLTTPKVRLFTDTITPTPDTDWLGLTPPTGSWFTEKAVTYGEVFENPDGSISVKTTSLQFDYTGTDPSETIRGYYVYEPGTPDVPIHGNNLPVPKAMGNLLDAIIIQPGLTIGPVNVAP